MNKYEAIEKLEDYERQMRIDELSERTIRKYLYDVEQWLNSQNDIVSMETMIAYKETLIDAYSISSVNSKLISVNRYVY